MSNDNVFPFPTSANQGPPMPDNTVPQPKPQPTPEELQKMQQQGGQELLQLITKNRKLSHEHLQSATEALDATIKAVRAAIPDKALMVCETERDGVYFSLEDTLRTISRGLGACLTSMEANNSLTDMLIHDLGGIVHNMNETQKAMLIANSHVQNLLELLKKKGVVSDAELKNNWEELIASKQQEAREKAMTPPSPQGPPTDSDQQ